MNARLQQLTIGWTPIRMIKLAFGILLGVEAIRQHDWLVGLMSGFFLFQSVTNTGCCGTTCSSTPTGPSAGTEDITYEEIK